MDARSIVNRALAVGGALIILLQTMMIAYTRLEVSVVLVGLLINQVGVWGLGGRLLPDRRAYPQLRREVRRFLALLRQLNQAAVGGSAEEVESTRIAMHEAVDRMSSVAAVRKDG